MVFRRLIHYAFLHFLLNSFKSITKTNQLSRTLKHTDLKTEAVHCRGQGRGQGQGQESSRPRPQNFVLELSSRSMPVLEYPIPGLDGLETDDVDAATTTCQLIIIELGPIHCQKRTKKCLFKSFWHLVCVANVNNCKPARTPLGGYR